MSIVSSPFTTTVLLPSNSTVQSFVSECLDSVGSRVVFTIYTLLSLLLLPLYVFVLVVGLQRWRRQRAGTAMPTMSHSDFFTLQMMVVEILGVWGSFLYTLGAFTRCEAAVLLGVYLLNVIFPGQSLFHVLTCVERYLAVVHALTYVHTRERIKLGVRNVSTALVWLLCSGWIAVVNLYLPDVPTTCLLPCITFCLLVTLFCSQSVLRSLTRARLGEVSGAHRGVDPSKKRAFNMIVVITAVLLLRVLGLLVCFGFSNLVSVDLKDRCVVMDSGIWLTLPSSLVLPLLFLHRAGKLPRQGQDSG